MASYTTLEYKTPLTWCIFEMRRKKMIQRFNDWNASCPNKVLYSGETNSSVKQVINFVSITTEKSSVAFFQTVVVQIIVLRIKL